MSNAMDGVWRSQRKSVKPAQSSEVVDLGSKFGVRLHGSDSESSDGEFEPEKEEIYSDDSHEFVGDDDRPEGKDSDSDSEVAMDTDEGPVAVETDNAPSNGAEGSEVKEYVYNPLIVRRSNRAIKPTKDIDLYLLGAQFGVDVEGSDVDTSDAEFSPRDDAGSLSGSSLSSEGLGTDVKDVPDESVSQSVSEFSSVVNYASSAQVIDIPLCAVCLEDSQDDGDIVECDWCGISVHEGCYGVPEDDGVDDERSDLSSFTTIPWFCDACKAGLTPTSCHCDLCPNIGGLFKQSVNGRWVHVVCGLYTPGIEYVEPNQLSGVTLDQLPAVKWGGKECQLCEEHTHSWTGICIGCDAGMCKSSFHVTCAQRYGLLCEVDSDDEEKELCDPYFAHCKAHADKDIARRKKRDYLTVLNKQKSFVRNTKDDRIQHYLDDAKTEYFSLLKKMQKYFKPELTFRNEERRLQHMPSAFHRLTAKAQLLGYETEVIGHRTETRRMVAPGLTVDFVNYFFERQNRMSAVQGNCETLTETNSSLKEEEMKVKEQLIKTERALGIQRSKGQQLQSQSNTIYLNLSRLAGKELTLPDSLREVVIEEGEDETTTSVCVVCEKSHDCHLMVLCDTCDNHYHIGCVDPPLSKVPKKSVRWGWECHKCCRTSGDELVPTLANYDEPSSRSGRKIQPPKTLLYPDTQVYKNTKRSKGKSKKQ